MAPTLKRGREESSTATETPERSRKEIRKELRKLKKMRKHAYLLRKQLPTVESLEKEREDNRLLMEKRKKLAERQKRKRSNRRMRKREEEMENDRKTRELEIVNKKDNKILKDLEKKLRVKKDKGLPKSFMQDNMNYVLDYLEEAKACMVGTGYVSENEGDDDDDDDGGLEKIKSDDGDSDIGDDGDDEEEEGSSSEMEVDDEEESGVEEEESSEEEYDDDDGEEEDSDDDGEEEKPNEKATIKKTVRFSLPDDSNDEDDDDDDDDNDDDKEDDDDEEDGEEDDDDDDEVPPAKKRKTDDTGSKANQLRKSTGLEKTTGGKPQEDIYGRAIGSGGAYVPPARRMLENLGDKSTVSNERLNRQVFGILNKLNEGNTHQSCNEFEQMYRDNSRQAVCLAFENAISKLCLTDEACTRSLIVHCCFLVAVLHSKVGTEVSAGFLQFVVTKFSELFDKYKDHAPSSSPDDDNDKESSGVTNKINNCLLIICQLYDFKIIESVLVLDIVRKMLERFSIKDINLISLLFREAGPRLRKEDPISFKGLLQEVVSRSIQVSEEESSKKKLIVKNLVDFLMILKNNQLNKIPTYDPGSFARTMKAFSAIVKSSANVPLRVTLEDIESCETRGKWWLVGSAWSGRSQDVSKENKEETSQKFEQKLLKQAQEQRMNTAIRSNIFCTMMSSEDIVDAFEKLLKLDLTSEQQHEIVPIIITTCLQGKVFNPFFAHLTAKFCKYNRKFLMACKFSLWDQIKLIGGMSKLKLNNLIKLMKMLISWDAIPLTTLKNIDFTNMDDKTTHLVDQLLRHLLTKCDNFPAIFRSVSINNSFRDLRNSLDFYVRVFYVERNGEDRALVKSALVALSSLNQPVSDVRPSDESTFDLSYSPVVELLT